MIPLNTVFWAFVALFGLVGALRGWAKEIMVVASVLLALFVQQVIGHYILGPNNPYLPMLLDVSDQLRAPAAFTRTQFWVCTVALLMLTFFGYAGPTLAARFSGKMAREKLQDVLLGFFLGLINGYLIVSTLWFFLAKSGYIIGGISAPPEGSTAWVFATRYLVPLWLTEPILFIAIAVAFIFVIVVFI